MRTTPTYVVWTSSVALLVAACSDVPTAADLNPGLNGGTAGTGAGAGATAGSGATAGTNTAGSVSAGGTSGSAGAGATGGTSAGVGSTAGVGGSNPAGGTGGTVTAGAGGAMGGSSGVGPAGSAGVGGDTSSGGVGGSAGDTASGGSAGTAGDTASGGTAGTGVDPGPYGPRTGTFKMLVFSETLGFEHGSIPAGQQMLRTIGQENNFEVTVVPDETVFTLELMLQYEIVFFMNTTGDIFNGSEEAAFEEWMTEHNGAFAGSHSATDTESGWGFYKQVTGQYYDQHDAVIPGTIQWEAGALTHPTVVGLPNPWQRNEEWYKFNSYQDWSSQEGFQILSKVTTNGGGTRPVSYVRQYNNFRAFYCSIGHETQAFQDADVKKHFAAGILWAVRREAMTVQ
jgi:type 1 glutamine amidotransferase